MKEVRFDSRSGIVLSIKDKKNIQTAVEQKPLKPKKTFNPFGGKCGFRFCKVS